MNQCRNGGSDLPLYLKTNTMKQKQYNFEAVVIMILAILATAYIQNN
jgi:hypothetical protein